MLLGHRLPFTVVCLAAVMGFGGGTARAQDSTSIVAMTECSLHLPPTASSRVAVYAYVHVDSGASDGVRAEAENFLPDVAAAITRELHGTPGVLPRGNSAVGWQWVDGSVRVTAFADGRMTWQTGGAPHGDGATRLLVRALESAVSAGVRIPLYADGSAVMPDSIVFWIKTVHPELDHSGRATPMKFEGTALPVFTLAVPWFEPAHVLPGSPAPHYPDDARSNNAVATVVEDFVVDSGGRIDLSSIHEEWPTNVYPPTGDKLNYWREFVTSVHQVLPSYSFTPARVGGCPVAQRVRQPFQFSLGRVPPFWRDTLPE